MPTFLGNGGSAPVDSRLTGVNSLGVGVLLDVGLALLCVDSVLSADPKLGVENSLGKS